MKQRKFAYSVLKFRTSYVLDERVNIGLLFRFENAGTESEGVFSDITDKYSFIFPKSLSRVTSFFPEGVKVKNLNKLLYGFNKKINEANRTGTFRGASLEEFIQSELLARDANSYFFSEVKYGVYDSRKAILEYYRKDYFKFFKAKYKRGRDDNSIRKLFWDAVKNKINQGFRDKLPLFKSDVVLDNGIVKTEFDYGWQNGTFNYVKPLNFDLVDEGNISNKAFKWYGELTHLKDIVAEKNGKIDLLISKPSKKSLFKVYDKALNVLEEIETEKTIIEEEQISDYAEKAVESIVSS